MSAGKHNARTAIGLLYVHHVNLDVIALVQFFIGDLLDLRQGGFVMTDSQYRVAGLRVDTLDKRGNKLAVLTLEIRKYLILFAGTNALTEIVL